MKFCKPTFSLSLLLLMPLGIQAMESIAKNLIIKAGNKSIEIQKGHALSSGTIKQMVEDVGMQDILELAPLEQSLELMQPYFKHAYLEDNQAIQQQLRQHSVPELALITNASNYLDMESVRRCAIKALAQKLVKEENLYQCLTDKKGSYDFTLAPDMERALAQDMLKLLPGLKNNILFKHILISNNGIVPHKKFTGHASPVESASFSPDGTQIVTASCDRTARIWNVRSGTQLHSLLGHTGLVLSAHFSPDGTQIVTASSDKTARLWDVRSGTQLQCFLGHTYTVNSASFSPDGTQIATASSDNTARLWDVRSGTQLQCFLGHTDTVYSAHFSPDGTQIVTASSDKTARLWNAQSNAQLHCLLGHTHLVCSANFNPDGTQIVTASFDKTARIWDTQSGTQLQCLSHIVPIGSASFSPDGTRIATQCNDIESSLGLWDAQSGAQLYCPIDRVQGINPASFSPDGTQIAIAYGDGTARIWTIADSTLTQWFAKEIKPQQIAFLHILEKHTKLNLPLNVRKYPGFKIAELPLMLRSLINPLPQENVSIYKPKLLPDSTMAFAPSLEIAPLGPLKDLQAQEAKNKWDNLNTITKWGIGSAAAVAAGYGVYALANKYLPQHKK